MSNNKKLIVVGSFFSVIGVVLIGLAGWVWANEVSFFAGLGRSEKVILCEIKDGQPDKTCTPGDVFKLPVATICQEASQYRRQVSEKTRKQIFKNYGIKYPPPKGMYELDHFIPLALGGSNETANLWPQASPDYQIKDRLEFLLYKRMCAGLIDLSLAQKKVMDWRQSYKFYFEDKTLGAVDKYMWDFEQDFNEGNP